MKKIFKIILGILILLICTLPYIIFKESIQELAVLGYVGLIIACLISNMSVLIPSSSTLMVMVAAVSLNPILCIFFGAFGASIGEYSSYVCGRINATNDRKKESDNIVRMVKLKRAREWFELHDFIAVFMFAFLPLPIFDLIGIIAGNSRMNPVVYSVATFLGKSVKYILFMIIITILFPVIIDMNIGGLGQELQGIYNSIFER